MSANFHTNCCISQNSDVAGAGSWAEANRIPSNPTAANRDPVPIARLCTRHQALLRQEINVTAYRETDNRLLERFFVDGQFERCSCSVPMQEYLGR